MVVQSRLLSGLWFGSYDWVNFLDFWRALIWTGDPGRPAGTVTAAERPPDHRTLPPGY